jgi:integrase
VFSAYTRGCKSRNLKSTASGEAGRLLANMSTSRSPGRTKWDCVLKQAKRERYIAQNPLDNRDHFLNERKDRLQARPFTLDEEQRLLSVAKGYLRPLLILLLDSGLRPNAEALPLRWRDVDFERGMISVISSKTPAGLRTVPMTTRLKAELLRWKKLTGPKNSEFVFFYPRNPAKHLHHVPKTCA